MTKAKTLQELAAEWAAKHGNEGQGSALKALSSEAMKAKRGQ